MVISYYMQLLAPGRSHRAASQPLQDVIQYTAWPKNVIYESTIVFLSCVRLKALPSANSITAGHDDCSTVRVRRLSSPTPPLPQPLTELGVELEYVVQDEEEERDRVAEELYWRDAILQCERQRQRQESKGRREEGAG